MPSFLALSAMSFIFPALKKVCSRVVLALRGSFGRSPIWLGCEESDVFLEPIPVGFVAIENDHFNLQPVGVIHRAERKRNMVGAPRVPAIDRAAAGCAKSFRHGRALPGLIGELADRAVQDNCVPLKHGANGMARATQSPTFFAMALGNDDRRTNRGKTDSAT